MKEKEDKNNNVGDTEIENVGLVQKSLNTIKEYVSSEKLDQIEEIALTFPWSQVSIKKVASLFKCDLKKCCISKQLLVPIAR